MPDKTSYLSTSIGQKTLMALTGLVMAGFLVGHLTGNLLILAGRDAFNSYAAWLKSQAPLLWGTRAVLSVAFVVHVLTGLRLQALNRGARPVAYARPDTVQASWASRYMLLTGALVGVYLLFHLAHFTLGWVQAENFAATEAGPDGGRHDVYGMVIAGFRTPWVAVFYILGMVLLALHLSHGLASVLQTFGIRHPRWTPRLTKAAVLAAWALALGFLIIPLTVWLGWVGA